MCHIHTKITKITSLLIAVAMAHSSIHAEDKSATTKDSVAVNAGFEDRTSTVPSAKVESIPIVQTASVKAPVANALDVLPTEGKPGDVYLVGINTTVVARKRGWIPKIPVPPFKGWNKWLDEHENSTHTSIDWIDGQGQWWHTELQDLSLCDPQYVVGTGEFPAIGKSVYGILVVPGRTDPAGEKILLNEKIDCDYKQIVNEARNYARKDKEPGEPGSNGNGKENVGLGGPAYKPSQNCNTYIHYLLKKVHIDRASPAGAVGWDTEPHFPYSADAPAE